MNGNLLKGCNRAKGISLIEIVVALLVGSIILGTISSNLPSIRRSTNSFLKQVNFQENLRIFLLLFEDNFRSAEILDNKDKLALNELIFRQDHNFDGDFNDKTEKIVYRWNSTKSRIDRKSGNGGFQSILEGVSSMSWNKTSDTPLCFELIISENFQKSPHQYLYCRQL